MADKLIRFSPVLQKHLQATQEMLSKVGNNFASSIGWLEDYKNFFNDNDRRGPPSKDDPLKILLAVPMIISDMRTILQNKYELKQDGVDNLARILERLEEASKNYIINELGTRDPNDLNNPDTNASLKHLFEEHGNELRALRDSLKKQSRNFDPPP